MNCCIEVGAEAVIRVKKNNNNSMRQIKRTVNRKEKAEVRINKTETIEVYEETFYKIIKARWHIENRVFNNLKTEAALGHCFIHGGNAVEAILYLIFIASNLFQLFKQRRIKNTVTIQKELVRLLLKGLYLLKYDRNLIFSSG